LYGNNDALYTWYTISDLEQDTQIPCGDGHIFISQLPPQTRTMISEFL